MTGTGFYLARGWVLYLLRHHKARVVSLAIWGVVFAMLPLMSYRAGTANVAASAGPDPFVLVSDITPPPPQTVEVASQLVPQPPGLALRPYRTARYVGNTYAWGNCTFYVAQRRLIPSSWGNARTWLSRAQRDGFATGREPRVGAIAWTPLGYFGHVALVDQVVGHQVHIMEMNAVGLNRISDRWVSASSFQYIY
jgi:surface antigen